MKKNSMIKDTLIITAITLVAGLLLGLVHEVTAGPIAIQQERARNEACQAVFAEGESFDALDYDAEGLSAALSDAGITKTTVNAIMSAKDASGADLGYVVDVSNAEGYGGDVGVMVGVTTDGSISGISFLELAETAGMGMKAKEAEFYTQYEGIQAEEVVYTKTGKSAPNEIDAISGATVTTAAVTKDVNAALLAVRYLEGA